MDFETIRAALGELQHDAEASDAWTKLEEACSALDSTDSATAEVANLLAAARAGHERRGEWLAVVRLLGLELQLASEADATLLAMELGRVHSHELLDENAANQAYQRVLAQHPDDELASAALAESEERRAQWQERVEAYATEASTATDDVYKASMLMRAAEAEWRFAGEDLDETRVLGLLAEASVADPKNALVLKMLELIYRKRGEWAALATVLERWASYGTEDSARLAAAIRLARLRAYRLSDEAGAAAAYEMALEVDPSHPEAKAALSEYYSQAENWTKLVALYERDLATTGLGRPERLGDVLQIAMLHYKKRGALSDAAPWFQKIREVEPANAVMLSFYRDFARETGDEAVLLSVLQGAQKVLPEGPEKQGITKEIAQLAESQQDAQKAIEQYNALLRQDPTNREVSEALKALYRKTQGYPQLVDMLRHELERTEPSDKERKISLLKEVASVYRDHVPNDTSLVSVLNQWLALDETAADVVRELIGLYEKLGRYRDLLANQQRLAGLTTDPAEKAELLRSAGRRWLDQFSNVQNATQAFEELLAVAPGDREACDVLTQLYKKRRAWAELYGLYESQLPSLSGAARVVVMKEMAALAAERLKKAPEAAALYQEILKLEPGNKAVMDALEKHAERSRDYVVLASVLEQRIESEKEPKNQVALLQKLGLLYADHLNDVPSAMKAWRRVIELEPKHTRAMRVLRDHLLEVEDFDGLTELYASQGDFEGLAEVLSTAADKAANIRTKVELSYRAAAVYEEQIGNPERAFRSYERILSVDPLDARAARALIPLYESDEKWARLPALYELVVQDTSDIDTALGWYAKLIETTGKRLNDRDTAIKFARRAWDAAPTHPEARRLLEQACADANNWEPLVNALTERVAALRQAPAPASKPEKGRGKRKGAAAPAPVVQDSPEVRDLELEVATLLEDRLGRLEEAQTVLRRLVASDPSDAVAVEHLNRLLRVTGDKENLRWLMDLRISHSEPDVQLLLLHEWARIEEENFEAPDRASALYVRILELEPTDRDALTHLTRLVLAEGQAEEAVSVMRQHRDLLVGEERAHLEEELAETLLYRLDRPEAALQSALAALSGAMNAGVFPQRAVEVLQRLVQVDSTKRDAASALAQVYRGRQELRKEADAIGVLLSVEEEHERRLELYRRGIEVFEELDSFNAAFELMLKALRDYPDQMSLWEHASQLSARAGRGAELADAYRDVLRGDVGPELRKALCQRAATLHEVQLGDPVGATPYLEQVLASDPTDIEAFTRLKQILTSNQRWGELRELYDQTLAGLTEPAAQLETLGEVAMVCEEFMDDSRGAQAYYERMLELDPAHEGALRALDRLFTRHQQYDKLSELLNRRLELATGDEATLIRLRAGALYLDELHQPELALRRVEDVLDSDVNNGRARELAERILLIGSLKRRASELLEKVYEYRDEPRELVRVLDAQLSALRAEESVDDEVETGLLQRLASLRYDRLKDDAGAFEVLAEFVPKRPDDSEARHKLTDVGERLGQQAKVADVLERAATATEDPRLRGELLMTVGELRETILGDKESAAAVYRRVLEIDETDPELVLPATKALQRIYEQGGDTARLVEVLRLELRHEDRTERRLALLERIAELCERGLGDRDAAIGAWEARLEEVPDDLESLRALDRLYSATERHTQLVDVLQRESELIEPPGERREVMIRLAELHRDKLKDSKAAIDAYRAVHETFGPTLETLGVLARLFTEEERFDDLEECYLEQLDLATDSDARHAIMVSLGDLRREQLDNAAGALDAYRQVAEQAPQHVGAQQALNALLERGDSQLRGESAEILAEVYERTNEPAQLLRVQRVLADVKDDPVERVEVLDAAVKLAQERLGDSGQAFDLCVRAIREGVGHVELGPWTQRLEGLAAVTGRRAEQVELYRSIVDDVFDGEVQYELLYRIATLSRDELGDEASALEYFKRAVSVRPDSEAALSALERAYAATEQYEPLLDVLSQRAEIADSDQERKALMLQKAVVLEDKLKRPSAAIDVYEAVLDLEMDGGAVAALHRLYDQEGRFESQLELFTRELEHKPHQAASLHVQMSRVASGRLRDMSRAFDELEAALNAEPAYPEAMAELERLMHEPGGDAEQHSRAATILEPIYLSRGDYDRVMGAIRAQLEQSDSLERRELLQRLAQLSEEQKEDYLGALDIMAQLLRDDLTDEETIGELERLAKVGDAKPRLAQIYRTELERVDEGEPSTAALSLRTGQLFDELNQPELALQFYRRAFAFEQDNVELFAALDAILQRLDRPQERVELYRVALEYRLDPDDRGLLLHTLGELLADRLGDKEAAIEVYGEALRFDADDALAMDNLSRLYYDTERYEDLYELVSRRANSAIEDAQVIAFRLALAKLCKNELSDPERAIEQLEEIVRLEPRHEDALQELNQLRRVSQLRERVVDILRPIYELTDDWRATIELNDDRLALAELPGDRVAILRETATLWEHRAKDPDQAMDVIADAVRIDPDDDEIRDELERLAELTERWDDVATVYGEVLGIEPSARGDVQGPQHAVEVWLRLAQIHDGPRNDPRAALTAYEQVRKLDPNQLEPLERMEALATLLSDWEVLDAVLVAKADLVYDDDERASLWRRVGEGRRDMLGQPIEAISAYENALQHDPSSGFTVDCLIELYEEHDNPARLVELYEQRVELNEPDDSEASFELLVKAARLTEARFNDVERTIELYNQALTHKPDDVETLKQLDRLYRSQQQWPELLDNLRLRAELSESAAERLGLRVEMGDLLATRMDSFAEALEVYQLVLEQTPSNAEVRAKVFKIGEEHEELREPAAAILIPALVASEAHDERAKALEMRLSVETDPITRADTLRAIANVHQMHLGDKKAALEALLRAVVDVPEDDELHRDIEQLCAETADYAAYATTLSERAQTTFDADVGRGLLARLGSIARDRLQDPKRAIAAYSRAIELVGDEPSLLAALDGLYESTENWAQLADVVERRTMVVETDDQRAELYARLADLQLNRFGEGGQALASLRMALELNPLHEGARTQLEQLIGQRDLFEEASEVLEGVYRTRGLTDALATLYEKRVEFADSPDARQEMRKALAEVLEQELNNPSGAQRVLQQGLAEDPEDAGLVDEVERLANISGDWASAAEALNAALSTQRGLPIGLSQELTLRLSQWYAERVQDVMAAERVLLRELNAPGASDDDAEELLARLDALQARPGQELARAETLRRRALAAADDATSEEFYRQAEALALGASDVKFAEQIVRELLTRDEHHTWALTELSRLREQAGDHAEVYKLLERRLESALGGDEATELRHSAARLAQQLNKPEDAIAHYERLFEDDPLDQQAAAGLRELYGASSKYEELASLIERLVDIEEDEERQSQLRLELAELRANQLGDVEGAIDLLRTLVEEQPNQVTAVLRLTSLYESQSRYEDLAELLTERIESYRSEGLTEEQTQCELRLASLYDEKLGEPAKAMSVLEDVLARDPGRREALVTLSQLQENQGELRAAVETLARLVDQSEGGEKVALARRLANIFQTLGDLESAAAALEQAFLVDPVEPTVREELKRLYKATNNHAKLAEVMVVDAEHSEQPAEQVKLLRQAAELYLSEGSDAERAAELLDAASRIAPDDRGLLLLLCDAYTAAGRANDAVTALERVVESFGGRRSRELADVHRRLAAAYRAQGAQDKAVAELDKAFRIEPGNVAVLKGLGELTIETGDYKRAQQMFRALLLQKLDHTSPITKGEVYYYLGLVHHKLNENDKAVQMLERAVQTEPDLAVANELLQQLK
jgi:tetratricopeptide (TPR) repeat protein